MKDILQEVNHNDGLKVPDGYFADFASRMAAELPRREWEDPKPRVVPKSLWQKVRPYVYLAAMFAGVWCMMNMVDMIRSASGLSVENSQVLTAAISNEQFMNDYFVTEGYPTDYQLMEDLYDDGFTTTAFTDSDTDYQTAEI